MSLKFLTLIAPISVALEGGDVLVVNSQASLALAFAKPNDLLRGFIAANPVKMAALKD